MAPPPSRAQGGHGGADAEQDASQVYRDDPVKVPDRFPGFQGPAAANSGVKPRRVPPAEPVPGQAYRFLVGLGAGDIAPQGRDAAADHGQPGQCRGIDIDRDHAVPAFGVQFDRGTPDPGRRAGDQHYLIAHVHSVELPATVILYYLDLNSQESIAPSQSAGLRGVYSFAATRRRRARWRQAAPQ